MPEQSASGSVRNNIMVCALLANCYDVSDFCYVTQWTCIFFVHITDFQLFFTHLANYCVNTVCCNVYTCLMYMLFFTDLRSCIEI